MSHGNRTSWWEWFLLDRQTGALISELSGVREGSSSINLNVNAPTRLSAGLTWSGKAADLRDWGQYHLQPWYVEKDDHGTTSRWPLGVFLPATPAIQYGETDSVVVPIQLYDKSLVLREDQLPVDLAYPVGTNPVAAITEQIELALGPDQQPPAIDETSETLRTSLFWRAGTPRLRVVNDLLKAIGYFSIWADYTGRFQGNKYVRPADRQPEYHFHSGETCIYLPNYELQRDTFKVPNQLVLISQGDAEQSGLVSIATNENPAHPFSYQRRGRWISQTIENVEATSQEVLDAEAQRRLEEMSNVAATIQLTHAPVQLYGHDMVHFSRTSRAGLELELYGTVQAMTMQDNGLWTTNLREALPGTEEEVFEE